MISATLTAGPKYSSMCLPACTIFTSSAREGAPPITLPSSVEEKFSTPFQSPIRKKFRIYACAAKECQEFHFTNWESSHKCFQKILYSFSLETMELHESLRNLFI
jgi:hypothetical protein